MIGKYNAEQNSSLTSEDTAFGYDRNQERIRAETALDVIYIIRTSVGAAADAARSW